MINFDDKLKTSLKILAVVLLINLVISISNFGPGGMGVSSLILFSLGLVFVAGVIIGIKIKEVHWQTVILLKVEIGQPKNLNGQEQEWI